MYSTSPHHNKQRITPTLITITSTQVLWCLERLTRTTVSYYETTRTNLTICLPARNPVCSRSFRSSCFSVYSLIIPTPISIVVVWLFIDTQNRLVALHSALFPRLT